MSDIFVDIQAKRKTPDQIPTYPRHMSNKLLMLYDVDVLVIIYYVALLW